MKTINSMRLTMTAALAAAALGACVAQPKQQCQVAAGSPLVPLPNFWASYVVRAGAPMGSCAELTGDEVGFQTYTDIKDDNNLRVAIRASTLGAMYAGEVFAADTEAAPEDTDPDTGVYTPSDEPVARIDPTDPKGKNINSVVKMTPFPDSQYVCGTDGVIPPAHQDFQAETLDLADGGTQVFAALPITYQWKDVKFYSSPAVPGQAFKATLEYTDDVCTASYDVQGIWPMVDCTLDLDCNAVALPDLCFPDGGFDDTKISSPSRCVVGSSLNPDLKVKCDTVNGKCILAEPFESLLTVTAAPANQ